MPDDKIPYNQSKTQQFNIPKIKKLNHFAWRCRDAEETRHFYEDILGLPLVHTISLDYVPSTGEHNPYLHLFFQMQDGSCIAFFDLADGQEYTPDPKTPLWVNHFAFEVDSYADVLSMQSRLKTNGIKVIGPTDHGFIRSIYFFDPNNLRLEVTCSVATKEETQNYAKTARSQLATWLEKHPKS